MVDNISKDLDVYSTSLVKNYNILNLTRNPLSEEVLSSMGIPVVAKFGVMQLHKSQLFLKTNESCGLKINEPCDQTETCMELEERDKIKTNKKRLEDSGKKIMETNLDNVQMKDSESGIYPI